VVHATGPQPAREFDRTHGAAGGKPSETAGRSFPKRAVRTFGNGRYEVLARIGGGGFSAVYRARDRVRGLEVAIKSVDVGSIPPPERASFRKAFQREASLAGRLDHHGIVAVFDHDADAEEPYIVMSLVTGGTLRQRLAALPPGKHIDWLEAVEIGAQIAAALDYARRHGVTAHRDIKPANIFRGDSCYKVGDFGIVRARAGQTQASAVAAGGTPGYMAPEQMLASQGVDWRADLFSLCAVLYEALTGQKPYRNIDLDRDPGRTSQAIQAIVSAANGYLTPLRELLPNIPAHVAAAIERGLQFEPTRRFGSWGEFVRTLRGEDEVAGR
jgi:serine/threonine-protein kinase